MRKPGRVTWRSKYHTEGDSKDEKGRANNSGCIFRLYYLTEIIGYDQDTSVGLMQDQ